MSKNKLKPCPFCGGRVSMVYDSRENSFKFYHINGNKAERCRVKGVIRLRGESLKDAAEAWNRRRTMTSKWDRRADAVEVVHGRWIENRISGTFSCSNCGGKINDNRLYGWELQPSENYCPNCGARMEAEDNGNDL